MVINHKQRAWTIKEIKLLESLYLHDGLEIKDIVPHFQNRTFISIRRAIYRYGLSRWNQMEWKDHEVKFLIENYEKIGQIGCAKILKRSKDSVKNKAKEFDLHTDYSFWTEEETALLKANYKIDKTKDLLGLFPHKTLSQIQNRMRLLGLKRSNKPKDNRRRWTNEEIKILKENYPTLGKQIMPLLPKRTYIQIQKKSWELKLRLKNRNRPSND